MQIIKVIVIYLLFLTNVSLNNSQKVFKNASLLYLDGRFVFNFDPIVQFFDSIELYVNDNKINHLKNIKTISSFDFDLKENENHVKIVFENNASTKTYNFNLNLKENVILNDSNKYYFSLNQLIDDYNKIIDFKDVQFFEIKNHEYEIMNKTSYINCKSIGYFNFNYRFPIAKEVTIVIYNEGLFPNLIYNNGYHFNLKFIKLNDYNYLNFDSVNLISRPIKVIDDKEIYIPILLNEKVIEAQIIIESLYFSGVNLIFEQVFNIDDSFLNNGRYQIRINDIDSFHDYSYEFEL